MKVFWEEVQGTINKIISKQILLDPKCFLLGLYPEEHDYSERTFNGAFPLQGLARLSTVWLGLVRPGSL